MTKIILLLISLLPLGLRFPYLLQAWTGSRLDKLDWIFYLLALPAFFWAVQKEKKEKCDFYALLVLVPMLFLASATSLHHINALSVAAAAGVIFSMVWLLYSWPFAYRTVPVFFILLCGTPSSSYQLSLLLMCPVWAAWAVKFLLTALCFFWIFCNKRFHLTVKKGSFFFTGALIGSGLLLLHTKELYFEGMDFIPEFPSHVGNYWGRSLQVDANTRSFFATSTVRQFRYTADNADVAVLAVQCGKNIHEIHPASHCLRTSMWTVHSENIRYLKDNFAVTEIDAEKGSTRMLVWVWYSSEKFSTPSFLGFRRHFSAGSRYFTYQISVPVYKNTEHSRNELKKFVMLLKKEKK